MSVVSRTKRTQLLRDVCDGLVASKRLDREAQEEAASIVAAVLGFDDEEALLKLDVAGMYVSPRMDYDEARFDAELSCPECGTSLVTTSSGLRICGGNCPNV